MLETEERGLSAVGAVRSYQDLWRVEAAFRSLEDVLELRAVWRRVEERVRAHVLVAALAQTCERVLQRKLRKAGWSRSACGRRGACWQRSWKCRSRRRARIGLCIETEAMDGI